MFRRFQNFPSTTFGWWSLIAAVTLGILVPQPASAQQSDSWTGTFTPLYLWATTINGDIAMRAGTVPVSMSFSDAADNLAGAFSFHFETEKNRFGIFSDLNFVRLSTESDFTLQGPLAVTVNGDADIDNTFFEAGASYRVSDIANVVVIGGLRTFTVSSQVEFGPPGVSVTPIDASRTAVSAFVGVAYRPALSKRISLIGRADIGGGSGMSWSARLRVPAETVGRPRRRVQGTRHRFRQRNGRRRNSTGRSELLRTDLRTEPPLGPTLVAKG